jgi:alkylated DNA repair protein (DNA oxidative demethylase)
MVYPTMDSKQKSLSLGDDSEAMADGFRYIPACLGRLEQERLLSKLRDVIASAPFFTPTMPRSGTPLSVRMTNCGPLGWVTDQAGGYRYQALHPETGHPWPPVPEDLLGLWDRLLPGSPPPEACLVNFYAGKARLGSHRDADEADQITPVLSVSLGDDAMFHVGGTGRADPKRRMLLQSGDVVILGGASRRAYHGIDRIYSGTSDLLPEGGRINLTLRRVTR